MNWHEELQICANNYLRHMKEAREAHERIVELLRPVGRATSRNKIDRDFLRSNREDAPSGWHINIELHAIVANYSEHRIEFSFCEETSIENPDSWSLSTSSDIANEEIGDQCLRLKFTHESAAHKAGEARKRAEEIFNRLFQEKTT